MTTKSILWWLYRTRFWFAWPNLDSVGLNRVRLLILILRISFFLFLFASICLPIAFFPSERPLRQAKVKQRESQHLVSFSDSLYRSVNKPVTNSFFFFLHLSSSMKTIEIKQLENGVIIIIIVFISNLKWIVIIECW